MSDYREKWVITMLSGVNAMNNMEHLFWGTAREAADEAGAILDRDSQNHPEYMGFSIHRYGKGRE